MIHIELLISCCFQCVKGNKFESDSQLSARPLRQNRAVSNVSKVINLKAIHNCFPLRLMYALAVSNVSKVINLKAIHNKASIILLLRLAVSNVSKVINLKAIHNSRCVTRFDIWAVSNVSKVINLKAIHNQVACARPRSSGCFQCVKGNKFESDSQQFLGACPPPIAVSNVSKVINLKAIHNCSSLPVLLRLAVSNVSKVINLKAIHNFGFSMIEIWLLFPMCQR